MEVIQAVKLVVYDLSNGMAATMSESILGKRIDGIWHTGVVVFGHEYFYGGGIQYLPVGEFSRNHGIQPVNIIDIGETQVSSDLFHEYLHSISPRFTVTTYDLINNNCNNFSHDCCLFLTGSGIPSYIIDLPKIVFSSPIGAMLRPIVENMQRGVRCGNGQMDPFGASYASSTTVAPSAPPVVTSAAASHTTTSSQSSCGGSSECGKAPNMALVDVSTYAPSEIVISGPIKSQNKDNGLLHRVVEKFRKVKHDDGSGRSLLAPEEVLPLQQAIEVMQPRPPEGSVVFPEAVYAIIMKTVTDFPQVQCASFYVLQMMLLYESNIGSCYLLRLMQSVAHLLDPAVTLPYEMSMPAQFLAVCSLSNYFSRLPKHRTCPSTLIPMLNVILDFCTLYISKDYADRANRPELRQWTASLLHNIVLFQVGAGGWSQVSVDEEIHPHIVQILCGVIEDIVDEADIVVLHRRLCVAHNIMVYFPATKELFKDLGFVDTYIDLKAQRASSLAVLGPLVEKTLYHLNN